MGSESDEVPIEDSDESLLDLKEIDDLEFDIPHVSPPSLESILWDAESEGSDSASLHSLQSVSSKFRSMLYHCILQGVSTQISSAAQRVNSGLPTAITNSVKYLAVGTSHGYILAFDSEQNLIWCINDAQTNDQGAVSALSFNLESTRLLVGYERGYIAMVDATNGEVLRRLPDAHAPQTAVLYLRFTFLNGLALCGDSSGCVFSLSFNRRLGVRTWDSRCLFSGARGEVCVFEPLIRGYDIHFLSRHVLVAMATLSKVIVISVKPKLKVHFSQQLPRISASLPLISWQLVSVGKTFQPVLAWGRGNELNYTRVITHGHNNSRIRLLPLRSVHLPYPMTALHWLGTRHLAILDTGENLRLVEVRTQRELEVLEVAGAGLVYGSAHFKALAVGGGVSEAFALAGERACYNSLSSRGDQLLILGTRAVHMVKLRSWPERLLYLSDQGRWAEALNLAAEEGPPKERFAMMLLDKYLENLNQNAADRDSLTAAVNCCVKLERTDVLCNELFEAVSTDQSNQDWYYTLITDHICSGSLTNLSPVVAQALVSYLEAQDAQSLENVLLSLEITCLDLHQALKLCKKLKLYNAWIHITTKTLMDYTSPLTEFLEELTPENHRLGNVMLVYVSSCLAGLGYPKGAIPPQEVARVKQDILRCLETLHSMNHAADEPAYPYLRALLKYNTRECLNVVELAFTEEEFSGEMGQLQRQRLVQILMQIVRPGEFSGSQVINLACFVSRLVVSNSLIIDRNTLEKVISTLTDAGTSLSVRDHSDREQAWLDLLNANKLGHLKANQLLEISLASRCYRVAESLYEIQRDYGNILGCYLNDPVRKSEVFNYILNYINVEERLVQQQFLAHFEELVSVSAKNSAEIAIEFFPDLLDKFGSALDDRPDLQYDFLGELATSEVRLAPRLAETYLRGLCQRRGAAEVRDYLRRGTCRDQQALLITREFGVPEATAFLLERTGEWAEALELLLEHDIVEEAVSLCVRGAEHLDTEGAQKLWLKLLQNKKTASGTSLRQLIHAAAPHVPPAILLDLVSNASFGDVKGLLQGMITDSQYDVVMLSTTLSAIGKDMHHGLAKYLGALGRGVSVSNLTCYLCQRSLSYRKELDNDHSAVVWSCGHCFHSKCVRAAEVGNTCPQCRLRAVQLPPVKKSRTHHHNHQRNAQTRPDLEGHF